MDESPKRPGPVARPTLHNTVEASLARLQLDHIDLYQLHGFDPVTPIEETMRALDDCVRRGFVRTIGCSNIAAWQIMKALGISERLGLARFETVQAYYSIAGRELEREILPLVEDQGLGVMVWSPLAGGFLSGKYARDRRVPPTRAAPSSTFLRSTRSARTSDRRDGDDRQAHDPSVAQVAIAWLLQRRGVMSVIVGQRPSSSWTII